MDATDAIDRGDRVSWRPEDGARLFGTVLKRDNLRAGGNKYLVRDRAGAVHYLSRLTKECG